MRNFTKTGTFTMTVFVIATEEKMKKIIPIEVRYGMLAPKIYVRIFNLVLMWWGWNNGKFEWRVDK